MKTVFTSRELAHVWANESAPYGRAPASMSFDGDAFKSYATVIARRIRSAGKTAYIYDGYSFSPSTSKHQSAVRSAIRDADKVFYISRGERGQSLNWTPARLRDWYIEQFNRAPDAPSRYAAKRAENVAHRFAQLGHALEVCQFFGLGSARILALQAKGADELTAAEGVRYAAQNKAKKAATAASIAKAIANAEQIRDGVFKLENPPYNDAWRTPLASRPDLIAAVESKIAGLDAEQKADWLAGGPGAGYRMNSWPVMLRAEFGHAEATGEMVTSKGARVPLSHAKRTFEFVSALRAKGWHRNGETHAVGGYQLDAVNAEGVIAGCHRVSWAEVDRFAASQGWAVKGGAL